MTGADITVGNGNWSFRSGSTSSVYPIQVRPSASGLVTVDVVAGVVNSISTGEGNLAAAQYSVQANLPDLIPTVEISGPAGPVERVFKIHIKFSEPVTGFDITDITVGNGAASDFRFAREGLGGSYTYAANITPAGNEPVTVDVDASVARDATDNPNEAADTYTVTANKAELEMTIIGPSRVSFPDRVADLIFTFSSTVDGFDGADIAVTNGTLSVITGPQIILDKRVYRATVTAASSSNSSLTVDVAASANFNVADQANDPYVAPSAITIEFVVASGPTVTITGPDGPVTGPFDATVTFSEPVTGMTGADITVGNGNWSFRSGSTSSVYPIQVRPSASGLVTVDVVAGVVNSISTGEGNLAAAQYSVQANLPDLIPTVEISGPAGPVERVFKIHIKFSEPVTGFDITDITVGNGAASDFRFAREGLGGSYTYAANITPAGNGPVTVDVDASVARDATDNPNEAADTYTVTANKAELEMTIIGPSRVSFPDRVADLIFTFSSTVDGFDGADIAVTNGTLSVITGPQIILDKRVYRATVTAASSSNSSLTVDVAASANFNVADQANDPYVAPSAITIEFVVASGPTVTITGPDGPVTGPFDATVTFSEPVTGMTGADITVGNGNWSFRSGSTSSVYPIQVRPSASGLVTVDVVAGVVNSISTGEGNLAAAQYSVQANLPDLIPTVEISGPAGPVERVFKIHIKFSEPVTGFDITDITVGNGAASDFRFAREGLGGSYTYAANITPAGNGPVTVDVDASVARDATDNPNEAADTYTVTANKAELEMTIIGPSRVSFPDRVADLIFTFSSTVDGFDGADIAVTNGTLSVITGPQIILDKRVYRATVTAASSSNSSLTVDVAASANFNVADQANDPYVAPSAITIEFVVASGPTVTITGPDGPVTGPFDATIAFLEVVSGFAVGDITVGNGTASNFRHSPGATEYQATITPATSGEVTVDVAADVASATSTGIGNAAAERYTVQAVLSGDAPTVTITGPDGPVRESFDVTITFSEAVTGFDVADITVGNGTASNFDATNAQTTFAFQAKITPTEDGPVTVDIDANAAKSTANSRGNSAATKYTVQADVAPTVLITGPRRTVKGSFAVNITFDDNVGVTGLEASEIEVSDNATLENLTPHATTRTQSYTAVVVPESSGQVTVHVPADVVEDTADNPNKASNTFAVTVDLSQTTGVNLSLHPTIVSENSGAVVVTVTAVVEGSALYGENRNVTVSVGGSGRTGVVQFVSVRSFTIAIPAGNRSATGTFTLTPTNNAIAEDSETITVSGVLDNDDPVQPATLTLTDDDGAPADLALFVSPTAVTEDAGATTVAVTAMVEGGTTYATDQRVGVTVSGSGNSAVVGFDPVSGFDITVPAGEATGSATFTLTPEDNVIDEADETITITGTYGETSLMATLTLTDDDAPPTGITLSVNPVTIHEDAGATTVAVTAMVEGGTTYATDQRVGVTVSGSGNSAVVGFDPVSGFDITVPAGEATGSATFTLTPEDNVIDEADETITITGTYGETSLMATLTLTDDDAPPAGITLLVNPVTIHEDAGATTVAVTATVGGGTTYATDQRVGVTVSGSGNSAVVGFDPVSGFDITVPAGEATGSATFTLTPEDNVIDEADETITITGTHGETSLMATLTLTDDDAPPTGITLSVNPVTIHEDAGATSVTVTTTVEGGTAYATEQRVGVTVSGSGNSAVVGFDPVSGFDITVPAGDVTGSATFTLTPEDNVIDEADETITITGTHGETSVMATLKLIDDDAPPTGITLSVNPVAIHEGAGATTVTVTATVEGGTAYAIDQRVGVTVSGSGNSGVVGFDPAQAFDIVVLAGTASATGTFPLTPVDNRVREADETVSVTGSHSGASSTATLMLIDDDAAVARYAEVSAVILPQLTRAMTASSVGAVAERIRKPRMRTASNGMALRVGGHTSLSGFMGSYRTRPVHGGSVPFRERLRGTSFVFSPLAGLGGRITIWGEGDYRAFSGGNDGIVGWDGSLSGIHLGVDADVGSGVLVGLAVSRTDGSVDYTYSGSNLERSGGSLQGVYASVMQSVHPSLSWSWSPGSNVWASAGFGGGEIDIQDDEAAKESSDSRMSVVAVGGTSRLVGNRKLIAGGSTTLDLKSEAWQSRVKLDDNGSLIDETTVDVNRLRVALEGAYNRTIAGGGVMTPFVELGLRSDGGDGPDRSRHGTRWWSTLR